MPKDENIKRNTMPAIECRTIVEPIHYRALPGKEPEKNFLQGYAVRFNVIADLYWFDEEILPGAFTDTIEKDDIRALVDHNPSYILGRNRAKTLQLSEDAEGVYSVIDPPDTRIGKDTIISVERQDVSGMSFEFFVEEENWIWADKDTSKKDLRQIKKAKMRDVSIVTYPAYEETDVSYRMAEARSAELIYKNQCDQRYRKHLIEQKGGHKDYYKRYLQCLIGNN